MTIRCVKCGIELRGSDKKFRQYARAQGWTFFLVDTDMYWRCFSCGPKQKPDVDGNR
jgi:hypothetical protein